MRLVHACYLTKFRKKNQLDKISDKLPYCNFGDDYIFLILMYDHFFIYLQIVAI